MKRLLYLLPILCCLLSTAVFGEGIRSGHHTDGVYLVVPSNADGNFRRGGPRIYLADATDASDEIQAAIDAAEQSATADYPGKVKLLPGRYNIQSALYIGYDTVNNHQVAQENEGCVLEGIGDVYILWTGSTATNMGDADFMLNVGPSGSSFREPIVKNIKLLPNDKQNGLYLTNAAYAGVDGVYIYGPKFIGICSRSSWLCDLKNMEINTCDGMAAILAGATSTTIRNLTVTNSDDSEMPVVRSYAIDNGDDSTRDRTVDSDDYPFWPGEAISDGSKSAIYLANGGPLEAISNANRNTKRIIVAHYGGDTTAFADNADLTGASSGNTAKADVSGETAFDVRAAVYLNMSSGHADTLDFEANIYGSSYPMLRVHAAHSSVLTNCRFADAGTSESDARAQADTHIEAEYCNGLTIRNVSSLNNVTDMMDTLVNVDKDDLDQDNDDTVESVSYVSGGATTRLANGDTVYLWDGAGGITDGEYTITADSWYGTGFKIDEDPGADATGIDMYPISAVARDLGSESVLLESCCNTIVDNVEVRGMKDAIVTLDSGCTNCTVRNIWDRSTGIYTTEAYGLYDGRCADLVADSGTDTQIAGLKFYDYSSWQYSGQKNTTQVWDEVRNGLHKTRITLHRLEMDITEVAADPDGWGTVQIYTFPQGRVLVLGVTTDLVCDATSNYDGDGDIGDTAEGDFSIGTTATSDTDLSGDATDIDLCPVTSVVLSSGTGDGHGALAASAQFDGTSSAKEAHLNMIWDAASVAGNTKVAWYGTVTILWVDLGDY